MPVEKFAVGEGEAHNLLAIADSLYAFSASAGH